VILHPTDGNAPRSDRSGAPAVFGVAINPPVVRLQTLVPKLSAADYAVRQSSWLSVSISTSAIGGATNAERRWSLGSPNNSSLDEEQGAELLLCTGKAN
jgi:hypothetical protein